MPPPARIKLVLVLISSCASISDGLQQLWVRNGRIKTLFSSLDPDTTSIADSISTFCDDAPYINDQSLGNFDAFHHPVKDDVSHMESAVSLLNATSPVPKQQPTEFSRRQWLQIGAVAMGGAVTTALVSPQFGLQQVDTNINLKSKKQSMNGKETITSSATPKKKLLPVNLRDIVRETNINLTMECTTTCVSLDRYNFEKKATPNLPSWVPSFLIPPPRTIRKISDSELLVAAIVAGSTVSLLVCCAIKVSQHRF
jgi:hypothetical protein